jgi:hypothetical protein
VSAPIRQALRHFLAQQAAITAHVGTGNATRIRPVVPRQGDGREPSISYARATAGHDAGMQGGDDLPSPRFSITSWAADIDKAVPLADAVREALVPTDPDDDPYPAVWGPEGSTVTVESVTFVDEEDVYDDEAGGEGEIRYGVRQLYEIQYRET